MSFVSGESHSACFLEGVFFYLFFNIEFLQASSSASQHQPVSVASHAQVTHQSQKQKCFVRWDWPNFSHNSLISFTEDLLITVF